MVRSENPLNPSVVAQTIIDGGENGCVVIFARGETRSAVLLGFTIQHGTGVGVPISSGGGIYISNASPVIRFVRIINNRASRGGGIYITGTSSPVIADCLIRDNRATFGPGGGILVDGGASPEIYNNQIAYNRAEIGPPNDLPYGGGIFVASSASVKAQDGSTWPRRNYPPNGSQTGSTWTYQGNTFSGNTHMNGQTTDGCHVYFK